MELRNRREGEAAGRLFGRELPVVFGACLALLVLLNRFAFGMPPVWDAAAGTFAPAVFLVESGFDLPALWAAPGYLEGGPNVHSLGLLSVVTAAAIALAGGDPSRYLPFLHALNLGLAAVAATATFGLARRLLGAQVAGALTLALLLFPLFLVQAGALHTEMAGACLVALAVAAYATGRLGAAVACTLIACAVKSFGLALVVALGLLVALDGRHSRAVRARWIAALTLPALAIAGLRWTTGPPAGAIGPDLGAHLADMLRRLAWVPDLLGLLILWGVAGLLELLDRRSGPPQAPGRDAVARRAKAASLLVPFALLGFIGTAPLSGAVLLPLPRYYCWVAPLVLIGAALAIRRAGGARAALALAVALAAFFALNRDGRFYPDAGTRLRLFSQAERSDEYLDFYRVQRDGVRGVAELSGGQPTFVTRVEGYYLSSPLMGWVDRDVPNVHSLLAPPFDSGDPDVYPPEFLVLDVGSNRYHGQHVIDALLARATAGDDHRVGVIRSWTSGAQEARLLRFRRRPDPPPSGPSRGREPLEGLAR